MKTDPSRTLHLRAGTSSARIVVAGLCLCLLAGCATTKKTAETADETALAESVEDASGMLDSSNTKSVGSYVDPMVSTAHGRKRSRNGMPPTQTALAQGPNALTEHSSSIAAAVTEPTGVRAGNVSIFSSHNPAAAAQTALDQPMPTAASPAPVGGSVNAMTRSVFSAGAPVACGNDAQGNMISC